MSAGLRLNRVPTPRAMEEALAELRDLEWRAPAGGRSVRPSPWAKDFPAHLMQGEGGDTAGEVSMMLVTDRQGRTIEVPKRDTPRPRTPLSAAEVARHKELWGWLELLADPLDRAIVWEASFHLWRGEPFDWVRIKRRIDYPHSTRRLGRRYQEALCKLICRVNGVPLRHFRGLLVLMGGAAVDLGTLEGRGNA